MSTATATRMKPEDLLNIPDDGIRRWLRRGELVEEGYENAESEEAGMTVRNRFHSEAMMYLAELLGQWRRKQPTPRGTLVGGEAGIVLPNHEDTAIGVDLAYISADVMQAQPRKSPYIVGVPTLVVEILSPSDTQERLQERIELFLEAGVPLVWIIETQHRTVTIFQPGQQPTMVNSTQLLTGNPALPGFSVSVADLFE